MNNNKKYKKWSLGLVAPALVLAPIAVVASCSSSGEEKPAYSVSFKQPTLSVEANNKNVKPSKLSKEGFVQEIINNKTNIFNIDDSSGKVTDDFLKENIVVGDITHDDSAKTASAKVTLNNKNTDGGSESATITLTGFDYQEADLENLTYTIKFKDNAQTPQEINLEGKSEVSVTSLDKSSLVKLVLEEKTKAQILTIEGTDAEKITNDVLENQILEVTDSSIESDKAAGTIKFELKVLNDGTKNKAEIKKEIKFSGFKTETETPPSEAEKFKIKFKDATEFTLDEVSDQLVGSFTDGEALKPVVISNKDKIFEAESGTLPTDQDWWTEMLKISNLNSNAAEGSITVDIALDNADTTVADPDNTNTTISKDSVVLKGFQKEAQAPVVQETLINSDLSTVTLGLNGNRAEVKTQINQKWILEHKRILFRQGFQLITDANDIVANSIQFEDVSGKPGNPIKLKFKVAANKWYDNTPAEGATEKPFETVISGISGAQQQGLLLANKLNAANPVNIGLVDPALAEGTYEEFVDKAAEIFNKKFVFNYRKNLLTGDFSKIDNGSADDFLFEYPADTSTGAQARFVKVIPTPGNKTIQIQFTILGTKLVNSPNNENKEYSVIFNGFKPSSN